jgi:translocator protein
MKNLDLKKLVISIVLPFVAGGIGSYFTYPNIAGWYSTLNKPFFTPPNWLFGPAWSLLYLLMGIALYVVWTSKTHKKEKKIAIAYFFIQLGLNTLWSLLFFGLKSPLLGVIGIVFLWIAIVATIYKFFTISKTAGWLLIPYIVWVSFAGTLNVFVYLLNR